MEENFESTNQKVWRYFSYVIALIGIISAVVFAPKTGALTDVNKKINQTESQIAETKKVIKENSPANEKRNFDLTKAEKKAQDNLYSGITYALGGAKNHEEFKEHEAILNKLIGEDMTKKLLKYNGERGEVVNNPDNFKFDLLNKTDAQITFSPVNDIHHAQVNAVTTYYSKDNDKEKKFRSLLIFDYDLAKQKVNSSKITNFDDANLSGNQE